MADHHRRRLLVSVFFKVEVKEGAVICDSSSMKSVVKARHLKLPFLKEDRRRKVSTLRHRHWICEYKPRRSDSICDLLSSSETLMNPNPNCDGCAHRRIVRKKKMLLCYMLIGNGDGLYVSLLAVGFNHRSCVHGVLGFVNEDGIEFARLVFEKMRERNVVTWTLMITRFAQLGCPRDAIDYFFRMLLSGNKPDRFTLIGVVSAYAELGWLSLGQQLHSWTVRSGLALYVCVGCSLVDMHAKCLADGSVENSRKVFDRMPNHNVMSWTALIT